MGRAVESILAEWRQLERELEAATDPDAREELQWRIARLRDEHRDAVDDVVAHRMTPSEDRAEGEGPPW